MNTSLLKLAILVAVSILLSSCAIPKNKFDAFDENEVAAVHASNTTPEGPLFEQLKLDRKVPTNLLTAPRDSYRVGPETNSPWKLPKTETPSPRRK